MERLIVTLRFIDIKDSYQSLSYPFKMSKQVISKIIPDVCDALNKVWLTKTTDGLLLINLIYFAVSRLANITM